MKCTDKEAGKLIALYEFKLLEEHQAQQFETHLLDCDSCSYDMYQMQPVWAVMRENPDLILYPEKYLEQKASLWQLLLSKPVLAVAGASVLLLVMFGINTNQTKLARLAKVESEALIQQSVRDRSEKEELVAYSSAYRTGLVKLSEAESSWLGFTRLDQKKIAEGIENLEKAASLAQSMENQTYLAECYLYIGKGYMMKRDLQQARNYFEKILNLNQSGSQLMKLKLQASQLRAKIKNLG